MKTFVHTLIIMAALALGGVAEAITIDTAKGERWYFNRDPALSVKLKVGEKVTVHYYITGRGKVYAKKIEKAGKTQ